MGCIRPKRMAAFMDTSSTAGTYTTCTWTNTGTSLYTKVTKKPTVEGSFRWRSHKTKAPFETGNRSLVEALQHEFDAWAGDALELLTTE